MNDNKLLVELRNHYETTSSGFHIHGAAQFSTLQYRSRLTKYDEHLNITVVSDEWSDWMDVI